MRGIRKDCQIKKKIHLVVVSQGSGNYNTVIAAVIHEASGWTPEHCSGQPNLSSTEISNSMMLHLTSNSQISISTTT